MQYLFHLLSSLNLIMASQVKSYPGNFSSKNIQSHFLISITHLVLHLFAGKAVKPGSFASVTFSEGFITFDLLRANDPVLLQLK